MKIDLDWAADGDGRSWRTVWDSAGMELGRIECSNSGYRYWVNGETGAWQDRLWEAIAALKKHLRGTA
jgi:hypothetical protein